MFNYLISESKSDKPSSAGLERMDAPEARGVATCNPAAGMAVMVAAGMVVMAVVCRWWNRFGQ